MSPHHDQPAPVESFTPSEVQFLNHFVTNTNKPVFALVNLPEVVKGALFARYSRSHKPLRRLLLDEFSADVQPQTRTAAGRQARAESLYSRVFSDFGDDSIAQLGSVHVACEGVSNIVTKLVERGRLMSYLEQSTRYIPYTDKPGGHWRYHIPSELDNPLRTVYRDQIDNAFALYASLIPKIESFLAAQALAPPGNEIDAAFARAVRAKALDTARGLLPASTRSNLGVFGSGQSYELLIMRLRASGNSEARCIADSLLTELNKVIPSFVARVDRPDRGVVWTEYLDSTRLETEALVNDLLAGVEPNPSPDVALVDFDPEGEVKVVAAAMYSDSALSDHQLLEIARSMTSAERSAVLRAYVGDRGNRRHRPGRAFERTGYRFDVLTDYGAFRDLQRHRLLSLDWQTLTTAHGYHTPQLIGAAGLSDQWHAAMRSGADLRQAMAEEHPAAVASYAVPMAYRIRYFMDMNAREAMHVLELRSGPQGHETYRKVAQEMHSLIAEKAGHRAIAAAMSFVDRDGGAPLERLDAERRRRPSEA
ncbi:MAG: FAD-dependent thymidylate synthase [Bifidobacteriaceae bacterium]|jgi:thymidylate synthase ThyX|nr:FAD-dependent thymidylate synthase [Bifidobacteriaceae bacterium]